jgi:hypothetical protein
MASCPAQDEFAAVGPTSGECCRDSGELARKTLTMSGATITCSLGWGAAWNYQQNVFISCNTGTGVLQIKIDAAGYAAGTAIKQLVGPSDATNFNDGTNCPFAPIPWATCGAVRT